MRRTQTCKDMEERIPSGGHSTFIGLEVGPIVAHWRVRKARRGRCTVVNKEENVRRNAQRGGQGPDHVWRYKLNQYPKIAKKIQDYIKKKIVFPQWPGYLGYCELVDLFIIMTPT